MKIDNIISSEEITTKTGTKLTKTTFLSDGKAYVTFAKISVGDEREVESTRENNFKGNTETVVKFAPREGQDQSRYSSKGYERKDDPTTMFMSYAKDIAIAGLQYGVYKTIKDTVAAFDVVADAMVAKYKSMHSKQDEAPTSGEAQSKGISSESIGLVKSAEVSDTAGEDDLNIEELPF